MLNIAVLGNSHVACIKLALPELESAPPVDPTFYAFPGNGIQHLTVADGCLSTASALVAEKLSSTSGGRFPNDLQHYDAFVIVGVLRLPLLDQRLSSGAVSRAVHDLTLRSVAIRTARLIRELSTKPIYIAHEPLYPEEFCVRAETTYVGYEQQFQALNEVCTAEGLIAIRQEESTICKRAFTRSQLCSKATPIGKTHLANLHMNRDYGRIVWEHWWRNHLSAIA